MKNIFATVLLLTGILINQYSFSQSNPRMQNPIYVQTKFFDDFKSSQLNRSVWNVKSHEIVKDKYQTNLFIWVDSVATVNQSNDSLNLSMLYYQNYRTTDWNNNPITANFIAGSLETFQTYSYGVYECKANFANQRGSFPAFWLMSKMPCSTSYNNEIDIVELKYEHDSPTLDNNIFYWPTNCNPKNYSPGIKENPFTWGQPHNFKCIWSPSKIEYWVDNTLLHTVQNTGQTEYPQLPQRVILSQQITMYNKNQPIYGIVTPQTSNFHWVKYREFFLAPEITCPPVICTSGAAVVDVDPTASNFTWSLTPTNLFSGNKTGTGKTAVITAATGTSGQGKITYTFKMPSDEIFTAEKTFWVGKPVINTISGPQNLPYGGNHIYTADVSGAEGATYQWSVSPSLPLASYGDNVQISFPSTNGDYVVTLVVTDCGTSDPYYYYVATGEYEINIIYPNPASDETTLSLASALPANELDDLQEWEYEIYSQNQSLKEKKTKLKGYTTKINTSGWKEGVYIVRVKYGNEVFQGKLIIER